MPHVRNIRKQKVFIVGEIVVYPQRVGLKKVMAGPLEQDIMEILWEDLETNEHGLKATIVHERVQERAHKKLAITTITTTLAKLCNKGLLEYSQRDPYQMFRATKTKRSYIRYVMLATVISLAKLDRTLFKGVIQEVLP